MQSLCSLVQAHHGARLGLHAGMRPRLHAGMSASGNSVEPVLLEQQIDRLFAQRLTFCRPHSRTKDGFFDFSHCRLFPLEYRLPARFDTIPSKPISQALANTSASWATRASLN